MAPSVPRFGTDGVRGVANVELTPEVSLALGRAAADVLGAELFVIGSDTRESGPMLEAALTSGVCAGGVDVESLGVVPTPAVAWAAADRTATGTPTAGAMISASHNPYGDNGIKLFAPGGLKLRDDTEAAIEKRYVELLTVPAPESVPTIDQGDVPVGRPLASNAGGVEGWVELICASVAPGALSGVKVVVDGAHGAGAILGPEVFRRLGADVVAIGDQPDGRNINDGFGSTATDALQAAVVEHRATAGLALDGDADRLIAVDEAGQVVDGDRMIAILAADWSGAGRLKGNTVVVTVMSNLGFHRAMGQRGIEVLATPVGDRHVLAALDDRGFSLGGEQSGHVICRDLATTGDGILTGVQLLDVVVRSGHPLGELAQSIMTRVPQVLRNVRLAERHADPAAALADEVAAVEASFGDDGRILVRASGTEPLLRIMVEHIDDAVAATTCDRLVEVAAERLDGRPSG
jgi:phosphoglucosamine mutase